MLPREWRNEVLDVDDDVRLLTLNYIQYTGGLLIYPPVRHRGWGKKVNAERSREKQPTLYF